MAREVENPYLDLAELPIEVLKPLDGAATQDYGSYPALETTRTELGDARG